MASSSGWMFPASAMMAAVRPDCGGHPVMQGGGGRNQRGGDLVQPVALGRAEIIPDGRMDQRVGEADSGT